MSKSASPPKDPSLYLHAAGQQVRNASYHLDQLRLRLDPVPAPDIHGEPPIEVQAHFEGVIISTFAAIDKVAEAINSALGLGLEQNCLLKVYLATPQLKSWSGKDLNKDLQGIRRLIVHHHVKKIPFKGPSGAWDVQLPEGAKPYEGSRGLRAYGETAIGHVQELLAESTLTVGVTTAQKRAQ